MTFKTIGQAAAELVAHLSEMRALPDSPAGEERRREKPAAVEIVHRSALSVAFDVFPSQNCSLLITQTVATQSGDRESAHCPADQSDRALPSITIDQAAVCPNRPSGNGIPSASQAAWMSLKMSALLGKALAVRQLLTRLGRKPKRRAKAAVPPNRSMVSETVG